MKRAKNLIHRLIDAIVLAGCCASTSLAAQQVVLISLDGAKPDLVKSYLKSGVLDERTGLARLQRSLDSAPMKISDRTSAMYCAAD